MLEARWLAMSGLVTLASHVGGENWKLFALAR